MSLAMSMPGWKSEPFQRRPYGELTSPRAGQPVGVVTETVLPTSEPGSETIPGVPSDSCCALSCSCSSRSEARRFSMSFSTLSSASLTLSRLGCCTYGPPWPSCLPLVPSFVRPLPSLAPSSCAGPAPDMRRRSDSSCVSWSISSCRALAFLESCKSCSCWMLLTSRSSRISAAPFWLANVL